MATPTLGNSSSALSVGRLTEFYPSPFFDLAGTYIPKSVHEIFDWCLYYELTNPIISAVTSRLSAYPVTDLDVKVENPSLRKLLLKIADVINLRLHLIETNLDRYTYGNSYSSVLLPIRKILVCRSCNHQHSINRTKYVWKDYSFYIRCKSCGYSNAAKVHETNVPTYERIKLIRWNPLYVEVRQVGLSEQDKEFKVRLPRSLKNRITVGHKRTIETVPQAFIEATKRNRKVVLDPKKVFHGKRASPSREEDDNVYGIPLIMPVLKDLFFMQVLRKAQEAVAMEHVVPMRVLFPTVRGGADDAYAAMDLKDWKNEAITQVERWRRDINYIPIMTSPLGYQQIGGGGKVLMLHQEIRLIAEQIISGMGVPVSFFYGEAQYSGASVNMKGLENEFSLNRIDMVKLLNFAFSEICTFLTIEKPPLDLTPFKMADDLQRASYDMQLNMQGKISDETLLERNNFDYTEETKRQAEQLKRSKEAIVEQAKIQAEAQGQATLISVRYQAEAQKISQEYAAELPAGDESENQAMGQEAPQEEDVLTQNGLASETEYDPGQAVTPENPAGLSAPRYMDGFAQIQHTVKELEGASYADRMRVLSAMKRDAPFMYKVVARQLNGNMPTSNRQDNGMPVKRS